MLRKLFSMSWFWMIAIFANLVLAANSFISFNEEMLIFNLLCAALCSVGWISSKYRGHI